MTKIVLDKLNPKITPNELGTGALYTFMLNEDQMEVISKKFEKQDITKDITESSNFNSLDVSSINYQVAWKNSDKSISYLMNISINKENTSIEKPSLSIYYDGIYDKKVSNEDDEKIIKDFFKFTVTSNEKIGV